MIGVSFSGPPSIPPPPPPPMKLVTLPEQSNDDVVRVVEKVLERAKAGELREVVIVTKTTTMGVSLYRSLSMDYLSAIGACETAKHWLLQCQDQDSDE